MPPRRDKMLVATVLAAVMALFAVSAASQDAPVCRVSDLQVAGFGVCPLIQAGSQENEQRESLEKCNNCAGIQSREGRPDVQSILSGPWTQEGECMPAVDRPESPDDGYYQADRKYCLYTDASFSRNRGISFLTTPEIASKAMEFHDPAILSLANLKTDRPYEIRELPGRGRGVFAKTTLWRGDLIMAHTPVGIFHSEALSQDHSLDFRFLRAAYEMLPADTRDLVMNMAANNEEGDALMERINTNAFLGNFQGETHFMMHPEEALMNHDCRPNTMSHHNTSSLIHSTYASRNIEAGEEITITYINILQPRANRQEQLSAFWDFTCTCPHCSQSKAELLESDARISRIRVLEAHLRDWAPDSPATPAMAEELIQLFEDEGLWAATATGYVLAALAFNSMGDARMAKRYAWLASEAGIVTTGMDGGDADAVRGLTEDAKAHWSWKKRQGNRAGRVGVM